jgi:predicted porin
VTPSYSYFQTKFTGNSTQDTSADKIISHRTGLGITHTFTPSISGSINGGVTFSKQKGAEETEGGTTEQITDKWRKNFTGGASLSKTYSRGSVHLTVRQNIGFGGGLASQSTRTRTVTGRIGHALTQKMNGFASLGWAKNDSVDGNAFDTNTYRIQAGLGYPFTAWLFANLSYSHIEQKSNGSAADDLRVDSVFLGLTALADPWVLIR